jgi:hypothetical protein
MLSRPSMIRSGILVAAVCIASSASATDPKNYPGALCVSATRGAFPLYTAQGSVENPTQAAAMSISGGAQAPSAATRLADGAARHRRRPSPRRRSCVDRSCSGKRTWSPS